MTEGPVDLAYICCGELPFIENFNTGLFETNQWTVDPGTWKIPDQPETQLLRLSFITAPIHWIIRSRLPAII